MITYGFHADHVVFQIILNVLVVMSVTFTAPYNDCPTRPPFTNVYCNLNIKKIRAAQGGPLNRGGHAMALLAY